MLVTELKFLGHVVNAEGIHADRDKVAAVQKFYLEAKVFTIVTDQAALQWVLASGKTNSHFVRWSIRLQRFDFFIEYRKGKLNVVPDALFRITEAATVCPQLCSTYTTTKGQDDSFPLDDDSVWRAHQTDAAIMEIHKSLSEEDSKSHFSDKFSIVQCIEKLQEEIGHSTQYRVYIPSILTDQMIQAYHDNPMSGHLGVFKIYRRLQEVVYWPGMWVNTKKFIQQCDVCQRYSEEEIRQKVGTFRQMLMEKEGVITREGANTRPPVKHMVHGEHGEEETDPALAEGYQEDGDCHGDYYDKDGYRMTRKSSSSPSPQPKKRKKKKSGRRRSRFDSSSPSRREKKKKSGKKHKRDRSTSGSRRKRRYRSGSPKNKQKDKNKTRKRSPVESPSRTSQRRGSCCSSRSASHSSTDHSPSKSPGRPNSKLKTDGHKACVSPSPSPGPGGPDGPVTWHNGHHHQGRARNGKAGRLNHNHVADGDKGQDKLRMLTAATPGEQSTMMLPQLRGGEHKTHDALYRTPGGGTATQAGEALHGEGRQTMGSSGRRGGHSSHRAHGKSSHSPAHSSDSAHSQRNLHPHRGKSSHRKKTKGCHSSKRHHHGVRGQAHHQSQSASPGRHRHTSASSRKKSESRGRGGVGVRQRSSSWSSGSSSSRSVSRERGPSKAKSPHPHARQNNSRERDSPHHSDADRARRRSRSYSPIRKRRRDSPSFMEARRITSARKRPIPYYRPSPSSSSSMSSPSHSERSRSHDSYSSYSRSHSRTRSHSRSRSRNHSYYSRSSYESPGF
ncbi:hypothetical protein J4Q44_G00067100 [Coregonus suidteri]|uniref:Gypsy retrotransposon integrase-like protein 1 n=1 Tax=Coregonus suidteri TaxID=861788 RepID=A0AAN8R3F3_9TELE